MSLSWLSQFAPALVETSKKVSDPTAIPHWLKEITASHTALLSSEEFMRHMKEDFFSDRIFVFTPKGDAIDLPVGSTGIDFAYAIHSWLGDHLNGVKVNGKLVSLDTKLNNGHVIEIVTKESAHPSVKWFEYAQTGVARRHIRLATDTPAIITEKAPRPRKKQPVEKVSKKKTKKS